MPYNFVTDGFHTKKLCSRLSSREVQLYTEKSRFAFLIPLWGLRGHVRCSCQAHWKAHMGLFARCYGSGATSEYWLKIGDFAPMRSSV